MEWLLDDLIQEVSVQLWTVNRSSVHICGYIYKSSYSDNKDSREDLLMYSYIHTQVNLEWLFQSTLLTVLFNLVLSLTFQCCRKVKNHDHGMATWEWLGPLTWLAIDRLIIETYWDQLMNHSVLAEHATEVVNNKTMKCREVNVGCLVSRWIQPCFKILKCKMYI